MFPPLHFALEAHPTAATLLIGGTVAPAEAVRAFRACYHLPARVRHLRLDLRLARVPDRATARTLAILLDRWRSGRRGSVRVVPPERRRGAGREPAAR